MDFSLWLLYLGVIGALIAIPGPSALLCVSDGLQHGVSRSWATVLGGALSALCLMAISAVGLGAVLAASEAAFMVLKLLGAAYLVYLGVQAFREAGRVQPSALVRAAEPRSAVPLSTLFRKGFLVGISNPKDLVFFAALFPSFLRPDQAPLTQFAVLALTWFVVECVCMAAYTGLGTKAGTVFGNVRRMRLFHRATGSVFVAVGGGLALSSQ